MNSLKTRLLSIYVRKTEVRKVVRREVRTQNRITQRITHGIEIIDLVASRLRKQHFQKTNIQMIKKALAFATTNGVQFPTVIQSINKSLPINLEQKNDPVHYNISKDTNSKALVGFMLHKVHLVKNIGSNSWMVTGYKLISPDASSSARDALEATRSTSTPSRNGVVAGNKSRTVSAASRLQLPAREQQNNPDS